MSDRLALLAAIRENPDEHTPRLAYADWLDEHAASASDHVRAEFIRIQIESAELHLRSKQLDRAEQLEAKAKELLAAHGKDWLASFPRPKKPEDVHFSLGFLDRLICESEDCQHIPRPPWELEPLAKPHVSGHKEELQKLISSGWFDGVHGLDLRPKKFTGGDKLAKEIANSNCVSTLRELSIWTRSLTDDGLKTLAASKRITRLTELSVMGNFTVAGWSAVANAPWASHLTDLTLGHRGPYNQTQRPGTDAAMALAVSPRLAKLRWLWVNSSGIGSDGLLALANSPHLAGVEKLYLDMDTFDGTVGAAIGNAFPNLTEIRISNCHLPDSAIAAIVTSPLRTRLTKLDLSVNDLTAQSARAIAESGGFPALADLDLGFNNLGDEGAIALANSDAFPLLASLLLSSCGLSDLGAETVAAAKWVKQLHMLFMSHNASITRPKAKELKKRLGKVLWIAS
jgi:uncharacterized protein (TIGR02996 family)